MIGNEQSTINIREKNDCNKIPLNDAEWLDRKTALEKMTNGNLGYHVTLLWSPKRVENT